MTNPSVPLIELRGATKKYGGVKAIDNVNFTVYPGEVHALCGDNAAGKSTLIKCLAGAVKRDTGDILINGKSVQIQSPRDAKRHGIETVYQDLALADNLNVAANLFLGREVMRSGFARIFINHGFMEDEAATVLKRLKIRLPSVRQKVHNMSGGQRQCVAIARAVYFNAQLIILDEPTAALGVKETEMVFDLVREMRDQGHTVIMISHNLNHVFDLCDRVTVMKTGVRAGTLKVREATQDDVVKLIMAGGRDFDQSRDALHSAPDLAGCA
ncbi:ATP-binding cassette domain-containing protein [Lentibacter algarum]|uniref:ATP-binding cassette domain-containing protein n=1 Tax=Lentibacter algarum TaxID=576131 RepID=UPI001C06BED1|nr:ATP-binding cassette domain-containing protein [Lentibacter algarum]MBU2980197.1 ATP-binding cassette domain-containing protein [Lentibacter algarum]